ncbi:MAG: hypothetical protein LBJ63_02650, partial [Prevotellaceae bacterium]|nr:hypothetical protein [Prevotellaceae bacterium]
LGFAKVRHCELRGTKQKAIRFINNDFRIASAFRLAMTKNGGFDTLSFFACQPVFLLSLYGYKFLHRYA